MVSSELIADGALEPSCHRRTDLHTNTLSGQFLKATMSIIFAMSGIVPTRSISEL
jgi:hypothetical protein